MSVVFGVCGSEIPSGLELVETKDIEEQNVGQKLRYDFRSSGFSPNCMKISGMLFARNYSNAPNIMRKEEFFCLEDLPDVRTSEVGAAFASVSTRSEWNDLKRATGPMHA